MMKQRVHLPRLTQIPKSGISSLALLLLTLNKSAWPDSWRQKARPHSPLVGAFYTQNIHDKSVAVQHVPVVEIVAFENCSSIRFVLVTKYLSLFCVESCYPVYLCGAQGFFKSLSVVTFFLWNYYDEWWLVPDFRQR